MKAKRVVCDDMGNTLSTTEEIAYLAFAEDPPVFIVCLPPEKEGRIVYLEMSPEELIEELKRKRE